MAWGLKMSGWGLAQEERWISLSLQPCFATPKYRHTTFYLTERCIHSCNLPKKQLFCRRFNSFILSIWTTHLSLACWKRNTSFRVFEKAVVRGRSAKKFNRKGPAQYYHLIAWLCITASASEWQRQAKFSFHQTHHFKNCWAVWTEINLRTVQQKTCQEHWCRSALTFNLHRWLKQQKNKP